MLLQHGIKHLHDEALQGQWQNNQNAADFLKDLRLDGPTSVRIPRGLGRVIRPDGTIVDAEWALVVPSPSGGLRTAYPILP